MRRTIATGGLLTLACLLAWAAAPPPPPGPGPANPPAPPKATAGTPAPRELSLADRLARRVQFKGIDDPKTTLNQALEQLARDYDLPFDVNEKAFKLEAVPDVLKTPIAEGGDIPPMKVAVGVILRKILNRVPISSGATYLLRPDHIEITTGDFARYEVWVKGYPESSLGFPGELTEAYRGPTLPLVHLRLRRRPLDEALRELAAQADLNVVLDSGVGEKPARLPVTLDVRNVPFDTALLLLTDMAGLRPVRLDNAFYVTTKTKAEALRVTHEKQRPMLTPQELEDEKGKKAEWQLDLGVKGLGGTGIGRDSHAVLRKVGPNAPVTRHFDKRPLNQALSDLAFYYRNTVVLDPRAARDATTPVTADFTDTPLDTAVRILADMAGLKVVKLDRALYVTTRANARELEQEEARRKEKAAADTGRAAPAGKATPPPASPR